MKITHKRQDCIGCNACVENAPSFWYMDEDGKATLKNSKKKGVNHISESNDPSDFEDLKEAEKDCPVNIIRILSIL